MPNVKVSVTIPAELLQKLDVFCKSNYLSRSTAITQAIIAYIEASNRDQK